MQSVDYVVKDGTGAVYRGGLAGDGGQTILQITGGQEVSLNLRRGSVLSYVREGNALKITLLDGRVIELQDFFLGAGTGVENKLYLSADGELAEVVFTGEEGAATFSHYADAATWGKWSPSDDLIFVDGDDVVAAQTDDDAVAMLAPVAAAGLGPAGLALAGLAGLAALDDGDDGGNGGGSSGSSASSDTPTVEDGEYIITSDEDSQTVDINGTAPPGSEVVVVIGDVTLTTEADDDGNWTVSTDPDNIPDDGNYTAEVTVTDPDGTVTELTGPDFIVDTTPPVTVITDGAVSTDDVWNEEEYEEQDGVLISGTGEAGSTVALTIDGVTNETTVAEDGTWSIAFTSDEVADGDTDPNGERTTPITVVSTDEYGNSATFDDALALDTETFVTADYDAFANEGTDYDDDATANLEEVTGDGVQLTGTTEIGNSVFVRIGGENGTDEYEAVVSADGTWIVTVPEADVVKDDLYEVPLYVYATDAEGNMADDNGLVYIDTEVTNMSIDDLTATGETFNYAETVDGLTLTGTAEAGATEVYVTLNGTRQLVDEIDADGNWSVTFDPTVVGAVDNEELDVQLEVTDVAGNTDGIGDDYGDTGTTITVDNVIPTTAVVGEKSDALDGSDDTTGFFVNDETENLEVAQVADDGTITEVGTNVSVLTGGNYAEFIGLVTPISGGSDAILTVSDEAGNSSTTYLALPDADTVLEFSDDLIENYNLDSINMSGLENGSLTLTEEQIAGLTENEDPIHISGESNNTVTITGATASGTETVDGETYTIYSIGDDGLTISIDDDINVVT